MTTEKLIYCVDDDDDFRVLLAACLRSRARTYNVREFDSGSELLTTLLKDAATTCPALLVLDLNMPGTNGYETLESIRQHRLLQDLPVIVFTNSAQPEDEIFCESKKAMMLTKPNSIGELDELVSWILENTLQLVNEGNKENNRR